MIVFIKLSARRYIVGTCPPVEQAWRSDQAFAMKNGTGIKYCDVTIIHGPATWDECNEAAGRWAADHGTLLTHEEWKKQLPTVKVSQVEAAGPDLLKALKMLMRAYESILPGVAKISVQDYAILNDAPVAAERAILKAEGRIDGLVGTTTKKAAR